MNVHYPRLAAATELERFAAERSEHRLVGLQLATLDSKRLRTDIITSYFASDKTWRMTQRGDKGESEIVWHIQGALVRKDIPPFDANIRSVTKTKARYLRQGVSIVGFNTPSFLRAIEHISEIHSIFSRCVREGSLNPSDIVASSQDGETITASNRYFTSRIDDPQGQAYPLGPDIDPKGTLAQLAGDRYFYGEDNVVCYLERTDATDADVKFQVEDINPVKIRDGDLVEVQVTFMLVPLKGNRWKMNAILRCITILDTAFALESLRRQTAAISQMTPEPRVRLKRRVGKDLEDGLQEEARGNKLQRMNVDD